MTATPVKWTLDDYHQMIVAGILDDRPVELLNGEIITMAPEGPEHAFLGEESGDYLASLLGGRVKVRRGRPITLPNQSEPEPDLALVKPLGEVYRSRHPYPEDIFGVIEFSNTSLTQDLEAKRRVYATAGIPEYWVVNLQTYCIVVFRNPIKGDYQHQQTVSEGTIALVAFPDVAIAVAQILQRGE